MTFQADVALFDSLTTVGCGAFRGVGTEPERRFSVEVVRRDDGERIEVRDARRRLVVEVDPITGRTVVESPDGDLALAAPRGSVDIAARDGVRITSDASVALVAGAGDEASSVALAPGRGVIAARALEVGAERAKLAVKDASWVGAKLRAQVDSVVVVAERCERIAGRVFERARSVMSTIDDLQQTKAGRVRTLVRGAWAMHSDHASMTSDQEVKIDGKEIRLG